MDTMRSSHGGWSMNRLVSLRRLGARLSRNRADEAIPGTAAPSAGPGRETAQLERRTLTVLFADVVGSTVYAEQLDPELWRNALSRFHETCLEEFRKRGSGQARIIGDGIMCYF